MCEKLFRFYSLATSAQVALKWKYRLSKKLLKVRLQAAKACMKVSQKTAIRATIEAVKAAIAIIKETIAIIIAGGWVAVLIIIIVCIAAVVLGVVMGEV